MKIHSITNFFYSVNFRAYATLAGILIVLSALGYAHHQGVVAGRNAIALQESQAEVALQKRAVKALLKAAYNNDSILKARVNTKVRTETRYKVLHDSIYSTDTVEIPQIVQLADSAIEASDSVIEAQKVGIALRDSVIAGQAKQIDALNREIRITVQSKPSRFSKVVTAGKWLAVGAVIGRVLK